LEEQGPFEVRADVLCLENFFKHERVIAATKPCQYNEVLASQG
jgi:hypothetical protein